MNIDRLIDKYPTRYKQGFIQEEIDEILEIFPEIDREKFEGAMFGNTVFTIDNNTIYFRSDVRLGLICGLEKRAPSSLEWD